MSVTHIVTWANVCNCQRCKQTHGDSLGKRVPLQRSSHSKSPSAVRIILWHMFPRTVKNRCSPFSDWTRRQNVAFVFVSFVLQYYYYYRRFTPPGLCTGRPRWACTRKIQKSLANAKVNARQHCVSLSWAWHKFEKENSVAGHPRSPISV